jgi:hypothetical protein
MMTVGIKTIARKFPEPWHFEKCNRDFDNNDQISHFPSRRIISQVVHASRHNQHCIALRHSHVRPPSRSRAWKTGIFEARQSHWYLPVSQPRAECWGAVKNADWRGFPRSTAQPVGTECLLNERLYIFAGVDFSLSREDNLKVPFFQLNAGHRRMARGMLTLTGTTCS